MSSATAATTSTTIGTNANGGIADYGLVSGIDTDELINAELAAYEQPVTNLQDQKSTIATQVQDYQTINTDLQSLETAATSLSTASGWDARTATSSSAAVTATAADGTPAGSLQFTVAQLAAANSIYSSGSVASTSQVVTNSPDLLLAEAGQLGFASLASDGLSLGSHSVTVTQASQAASLSGSVDLETASPTTITTGTNDTIDLTVDGQAASLVVAPPPASDGGQYTAPELLSAVQQAITAAGLGGSLTAGYDSSGQLTFATTAQGSSQSLQITGGNALSTLGLSTGASSGVDAVVNVDGQSTTLTDVAAGSTVTLPSSTGSITATIGASSSQQYVNSSLLSAGSVTATDVSTGNGSLADVVSAINGSGTGILASAVQTSSGNYVLQLSSSTTGTAGDLSIDTSAFASSALGTFNTAVAGQDAELQIGGAGGYTVSSQTNTFTGLLNGLTITANEVTASPVTVTVASDTATIAKNVSGFVSAANQVLSDLQTYAGYDEATKTGGALMGSGPLMSLTNELLGAFATTVGSSDLGSALNAGISISNGQLVFDQSKFESAYASNASEVEALFTQDGAFAGTSSAYDGQVSLVYASNTTQNGSYDVNVSQSATQASVTGSALGSGAVATGGENLSITSGGATATYTTSAGESLDSVVSGLNSAFAANGLGLSAELDSAGTAVEIVSAGYGSSQSFSVTSNTDELGLAGSFSGQDVEGTIDGVAATGSGQMLTVPSGTPGIGGMVVQVTTPGISGATDLGTFTYSAGLAQSIADIANEASGPVTGTITTTIQGLQNESTSLDPQITMYQNLVNEEQKMLQQEYATMESNLETSKAQSSSLTQELDAINANNSSSGA